MENKILGKVSDIKIVDSDKRNRVSGGTYITFITNDNVTKDTYVNVVINNKTHHFQVKNISIVDKLLSIEAVEVGYWVGKISNKKDFDLRNVLDLEVSLVTDEKEKSQIYLESCWC